MTKRIWSEAALAEMPLGQENENQIAVSAEGIVVVQERAEEVPATSGSAVPEGEGHQLEELTPDDVEGEEALAKHPFWGLLLRAGYTLW